MFKQAQSQNLASNDYGLDNKRSEMAEQEVLARLESATEIESLRAAILSAAVLNTTGNPAIQAQMRVAYKQL